MTKKEYNGYYNYETWLTALWIDNDQFLNETVHEMAAEAKDCYELSTQIKALVEDDHPLIDQANLFSDLLTSAFSEVNYDEIAQNYLDELPVGYVKRTA